jgi:hypothetical protein
MADMLLALARDHGVQLAGLEGATGVFATDEFKPYPDQEAVKKVAAYFMKRDILGGPEYAALASEKPITLWGIEDPTLYQANVKAVRDSLAGRTEAETFLGSLTGALDHWKQTLYTEDLKSFDKNQTLYDQGHRGLGEYVQALATFAGQKGAVLSLNFPNTSLLLAALREEKNLDFAVVERDRQALVENLVEKLTQAELQGLLRRSVDLRGGKTSHNTYNGYLRILCERKGLSLSRYPSLTAYMHYVAASEEIEREELLKEIDFTGNIRPRRPDQNIGAKNCGGPVTRRLAPEETPHERNDPRRLDCLQKAPDRNCRPSRPIEKIRLKRHRPLARKHGALSLPL